MPNVDDITSHLLEQDVVWVLGGSVAGLLAMWRLHGVDAALHAAWLAGVVLTGVSAGSICWHVGGTTDSFGPELRPVTDGLGFVPFSNGVHYDAEEQRRPLLHRLIGDGTLPAGYATDNGAGVVYRGTEFVEAVAETDGAAAYFVTEDDGAIETRLDTRRLYSAHHLARPPPRTTPSTRYLARNPYWSCPSHRVTASRQRSGSGWRSGRERQRVVASDARWLSEFSRCDISNGGNWMYSRVSRGTADQS